MTVLNQFLTELRQSRLLPVVAALLVALIAVPVLLSSSGSSSPSSPQASLPGTASPSTALPALSVQSGESHTQLRGKARDPFGQQGGSNPALNGSSVAGASALRAAVGSGGASGAAGGSGLGKASPAGTGSKGSSSVGSSVAGAGGTAGNSSPSPPPPTKPAKPAPSGLSPNEAYSVAVAMTDPSGGLNTTDPLERLSILPNRQQPLLVELGVLKGGRQVLFAVQQGAEVSGPGKCTPGPVDCEILSLGVDQIETVGADTSSGVSPVADFAVTAIKAKRYGSRAAADAARRKESKAGRKLLRDSGLDSLSLFPYKPSLGVVVDLRDLKVGGS